MAACRLRHSCSTNCYLAQSRMSLIASFQFPLGAHIAKVMLDYLLPLQPPHTHTTHAHDTQEMKYAEVLPNQTILQIVEGVAKDIPTVRTDL